MELKFQEPTPQAKSTLTDGIGRKITYVRLSVTDRCDLRCVYCMAEKMNFLPRNDILSINEIVLLGKTFCELGTNKLRITGGEPLIRQGIVQLIEQLGQLPQKPELCLTTNGTHLARYAQALKQAGLDRINISLDSLNPEKFKKLTRVGDIKNVLAGIKAAQKAGFTSIKLNCVALNSIAQEAVELVNFALNEGLDISFIEEMPLGKITHHQREKEFISSSELQKIIGKYIPITPISYSTGGPSRYWKTDSSTSKIGFISPHSENFCGNCNRIRVTATGKLILCLGKENNIDLLKAIRYSENSESDLKNIILNGIKDKPEKHDFSLSGEPQILRFMNVTGG